MRKFFGLIMVVAMCFAVTGCAKYEEPKCPCAASIGKQIEAVKGTAGYETPEFNARQNASMLRTSGLMTSMLEVIKEKAIE